MLLGDKTALTLKMCVNKITKIYLRQGEASKMFRDTSANSRFSDLFKIGKYTSLGHILHYKYNFASRPLVEKYLHQKVKNWRGLKLHWRHHHEAFLALRILPTINFCNFFYA